MPLLQTLLDRILDIVFPPRCAACRRAGSWFCESCFSNIILEPDLALLEGFESCVSLVPYSNREMRILLTRLKYRSASCLIPVIRSVLQKSHFVADPAWTVAWIPASEKRIQERGLDHARLIASIISSNPMCLLERTRHTQANATLDDPELRKGNVTGAFRAIGPVPEQVVLVDDVRTSGSTAEACAAALKEAGVKRIKLFTLAYGG